MASAARSQQTRKDRASLTRWLVGGLTLWLSASICCPADAQPRSPWTARLRVGAGIAQRRVSVPNTEGNRELDLGPTAAAVLGADVENRRDNWALGVSVSYRTSLAGRVSDAMSGVGAQASETAVRSHVFEAGLRPGRYFGSSPQAIALWLFAGYNVRAFGSVAVLRVPRYSLHGPVLRIELEFPLRALGLRLRVAPEAQWIVSVTDELRQLAGMTAEALAFGGEAQLSRAFGAHLALQLCYRESHATAPTRNATRFNDIERYLLLEASYQVE